MKIYRHGSNQYRKVKKSYALEASMAYLLTFYIGMLFLKNVVYAVSPDQLYLESLTFGKYPSLNATTEITIAGTSAVLVGPMTKEQIILNSDHPKEITHIWERETSKGTNSNPNALHNICRAQGKSNEFGYGGMANKWCYDSFEQAVHVVDEWLTKKTNEALCIYNLGIKTEDCTYVK